MKSLFLISVILISLHLNAQEWIPMQKPSKTTKIVNKVQCWGTTEQDQRCLRKIDTTKPGKYLKAVYKGTYIVYFCPQHAKGIK